MAFDVITIDGPTSSGKNSVGFLLAQKLMFQYIDTGMIYRVGTYLVVKNSIDPNDVDKVTEIFRNLNLEIKDSDRGLAILNGGKDLTDNLHSKEVTDNVSAVSAIREVREITTLIQRKLGSEKNTVMTGRDIGSEIFPQASHKFYLTAQTEVRAKRRFDQLVKIDPNITYEEVLKSMKERDKKDSEREVSPLRIPAGAVVIDNSHLTVEQTVSEILKHIYA